MRPRTIAALEVPEQSTCSGVVFGAWVVAAEALEEIIRGISPNRLRLYWDNGVDAAARNTGRFAQFVRSNQLAQVRFELLRSLRRGGKGPRIDHWHDFTGDLRPFAFRRALGESGRFPISICHHTFSYQSQLHGFFLRLLLEDVRPYDALICASTAARDGIRAILATVADSLRKRLGAEISFKGRLDVLPFGVRTELFRPRSKAAARDRLGLPRDAFVILWVGRISERDKADLLPLLRVFRRLIERNKRKDLLLVLSGSELNAGAQSAELRDYAQVLGIADRMKILSSIPPPSRHRVFAIADVFVSPVDNVQETFGLTPLEAMASGIPQVVADWNGYRDTVRHGATGFLVPTRWIKCDERIERFGAAFDHELIDHLCLAQTVAIDLDRLEEYLQLLLDHPALRARMSKASRQRAVAEYDWSVIVRRLQDLWQDQEKERRAFQQRHREQPTSHYTAPKFFHHFQHYGTEVLSGKEALTLTDEYDRVSYEGEPLPYYFGKHWGFDASIYGSITRFLERAINNRKPITIGDVVSRLGRRFEPEAVLCHVMWLLKYGYVRATTLQTHRGRAAHRGRA